MEKFTLQHSPTAWRILVPINAALGALLISLFLFVLVCAVRDPQTVTQKVAPLWLVIPFSMFAVRFFYKWVRDQFRVCRIYKEKYEVNELGITVSNVDGSTETYRWNEVVAAEKLQNFIIQLLVPSRKKALYLVSDAIFGSKFDELEQLIRSKLHIPLRDRWWF
jgi:hypothetical protein